jgi:hypothetical protein
MRPWQQLRRGDSLKACSGRLAIKMYQAIRKKDHVENSREKENK